MAERSRGYEVAVLGARCAGAAVAYALARRRLPVVVMDASAPAGVLPAPVAVTVQAGAVPDIRVAVRSAEGLPELQDTIGPFGYRRTGGLTAALTDADAETGRARATAAAAAGLPVGWLPREEALRREPGLSSDVVGAVYCAYDGVAEPRMLRHRLLAAASRFGAAAHLDGGYLSVVQQSGGFRLRNGRDEAVARRIVFASPDALLSAGRSVGAVLPLRTVRRRFCVTERLEPLLRHTVNGIRQEPAGQIVLDPPAFVDEGASAQDSLLLIAALRRIAGLATRLVPGIGQARVLHAPLRVSVEPADGRPAVGRLDDDIYLAVAGADQAVAYCSIIGETVAEAISRNRISEGLEIWAPGRFAAAAVVQDSPGGP